MTNQGLEPDFTTAKSRRRFAFSGIEQRVLRRLRERLIPSDQPIIVGFSGGPDSLCLAAVLARLSHAGHVQPILAHINHGVRPSSSADAVHAVELADQLQLPIQLRSLDPDFTHRHPGTGVEEAMRRERYLLLAECARATDARWIATAHHEDDQVETVLLHLFRGAGLRGVSGIAEVSVVEIPWWVADTAGRSTYSLWRPLLREPKQEIETYVTGLGLEPCIDESNLDSRYRRNAIRLVLVPVIDTIFPAARPAIARFAEIAGDEDRFLDSAADDALTQARNADGTLSTSQLRAESPVIQRRLIRRWLQPLERQESISLDRVEATIRLAEEGVEGRLIEIGAGRAIGLIGDDLVVGDIGAIEKTAWGRFRGPKFDLTDPVVFTPSQGIVLTCGGVRIMTEVAADSAFPSNSERSFRLPPLSEVETLSLRRVVHGDRFLGGERVDEWLRVHRVPVMIRPHIVCLANADDVLWIPGLPLPRGAESRFSVRSISVRWEPVTEH